MKRIKILILLLLILIISAIICYECCDQQDPEGCEQLIFVAVNRIPEDTYNDWQIDNQEYMYDVPTREKQIGTGDGIVAIDASKIREVDYAAWLRENGSYIFFEATYPYIECAHNISSGSISNVSPYISMNLSQIKTQIANNGGNFTTTNYNKYTTINISSSNVLSFSMTNNFLFDQNCFSVPLFRSIVDKYSLKNSSIFEFATASVNNHKIVIFRVKDTSGHYNYYDYSQIPP
ncbi:hypothetical protein J2X31_000130 [Flavobacterium arsenatis]|uniref:Uncharacterized protein n=1 Tax=Flavobacterium arsenatis TaxID=1484332 RepID=A0ABU1TJG7_9FLAO|nr:hypothetical protein [Flavobacterium arsenatis]MDR6966137.1 hypothetical protein [Flavobacterium arsenatis]